MVNGHERSAGHRGESSKFPVIRIHDVVEFLDAQIRRASRFRPKQRLHVIPAESRYPTQDKGRLPLRSLAPDELHLSRCDQLEEPGGAAPRIQSGADKYVRVENRLGSIATLAHLGGIAPLACASLWRFGTSLGCAAAPRLRKPVDTCGRSDNSPLQRFEADEDAVQ